MKAVNNPHWCVKDEIDRNLQDPLELCSLFCPEPSETCQSFLLSRKQQSAVCCRPTKARLSPGGCDQDPGPSDLQSQAKHVPRIKVNVCSGRLNVCSYLLFERDLCLGRKNLFLP